jgi:hypothetical protein
MLRRTLPPDAEGGVRRTVEERDAGGLDFFIYVAGLHRIEAFKKLL